MSQDSEKYPLHALLLAREDRFVACCLEFNLSVTAASAAEACEALSHVIERYLEECARLGQSPMRPAPKDLWNQWYEARGRDSAPLRRHPIGPRGLRLAVDFELEEAVAA